MIAFAAGRAGDYDIFTIDFDTSAGRQLTTGPYYNDQPRWSPDGKYIVYCASRGGHGSGRLQLLDVDTGAIFRIPYDRSHIESEKGAAVKDFGLFSRFAPDILQRLFVNKNYWGAERFPHWKV